MKKKIELRLIEVNSEMRELENEYPVQFPLMCNYKICTAKRELLTELLNEIKTKVNAN